MQTTEGWNPFDSKGRLRPLPHNTPAVHNEAEIAEVKAKMELAENMKSRKWRLNNLYFIIDEKGKKVLFRMNWAQQVLLSTMWYFNIILKARQLGFTTFICILFLDTCLFRPDTLCGIIAHNREDAEKFFTQKVRYAYNHLPKSLRDASKGTLDSTRQLTFANGSSISVGTSMRSGTLYMLHISEFGKVCARDPGKAKEIVTGGINTVHAGQYIFIESTAEGRAGYFYDFCTAAKKRLLQGLKPNKLQFKFYFFPWWKHPSYVLDDNVVITKEMAEYFEKLEGLGITLTRTQKNWYITKEELQGDEMKREYPSTAEEAFEASVIGSYYGHEMTLARKQKRLGLVPHDPMYPVNVFWDIGFNDKMALWFHQRVGVQNRLIHYYENSGEGLAHYALYQQNLPYMYDTQYMPHDGNAASAQTGKTFQQFANDVGIRSIVVVPRAKNQEEVHKGIQAVRNFLATTWIDESNCDTGLKCLDNYKKEWDANLGEFKKKPRHDWASNGADALRTGAVAYEAVIEVNQADLMPEPTRDY